MKNRKISIIQVSRLLLQIIFFLLLPSLYINTFAGIKQIYIAVIRQNADFNQLLPQIIEAAVLIPFTIIMGRFFCGWMCAFGSFGDFIYKISSKILKIKIRVNEKADRLFKFFKYVILAFLILIVCSFSITAFSTYSPWDVFGMLASVGKMPAFSYTAANLTAGFIIFIFITIASMLIERFFCRYLCPLGAVFAIASKLRIAKINKARTKCGNCRGCTNKCVMGIPLYKYDVVNSGECINCLECINECPRNNATFTVAGSDVRPLIAGAAAVSVMTGLYYAGNIVVNAAGLNNPKTEIHALNIQAESEETAIASGSTNSQYKDGTYQGSGTGFRGGTTTVSVTVKNGKIVDVSTISSYDDGPFYTRAFDTVVQEIIDSQSANVDAVSGSTFSSIGIMEAVQNALSNAEK